MKFYLIEYSNALCFDNLCSYLLCSAVRGVLFNPVLLYNCLSTCVLAVRVLID